MKVFSSHSVLSGVTLFSFLWFNSMAGTSNHNQLPATSELIESQLIKTAQILEDTLDEQINYLDNLNDDDLETIRQLRIKQMKEESKQRSEWLAAGHGVYSELSNEKEFFTASKTSLSGLVCHFYRDSTFRCKIVDKHLSLLAPKHIECRMVKINAEKSPFLTKRLNILVIPTLILVKNEKVCDRIVGFDELGGNDEFPTALLEWRLAVGKVIKYSGDLSTPPDAVINKSGSSNMSNITKHSNKSLHSKCCSDSDDNDND
ncbi:Thioredoxin domain-containing protein isoform 1 [Schistosoma japonicum]|uniref:Thioredoxin domain-containing protein 9 n=2 Tax=Schistosoma japonicum TaxID=6182 RepID=A0A4Z2D729_SCHJA|nr:Thioredoxin domain-containing protein isoform 1 [Schistosoma japonicum]